MNAATAALIVSLAGTPAITPGTGSSVKGEDKNSYFTGHVWQQTVINDDVSQGTVGLRALSNFKILGRFRIGLRVESSALPGADFEVTDINSYDTIEWYAAPYVNVFNFGYDESHFSLGLAAVFGQQLAFKSDLYADTRTLGGCVRGGWNQSYGYACYGEHAAGNPDIALDLCNRGGSCGKTGFFGSYRVAIKGALGISGDFALIDGHKLWRFGPEAKFNIPGF